MTYEEALNKLLQVAGNYTETYNTYTLSRAIIRKELEQIHKEAKKLVGDLLPSSQFLNISLDACGYPAVYASNTSFTYYTWIYGIPMNNNAEEAVRSYFEKMFLAFLREYTKKYQLTLDELTRVNSYISLIYRNLTSGSITPIVATLQEYRSKRAEEDANIESFGDYCANVRAAMKDTAVCWVKEAKILPGMKLSIINLKTRASEVRTVKKVSYSDGVRVLAFEECSSIVRGDERIESVKSWLVNNPEHSDLSKIYY